MNPSLGGPYRPEDNLESDSHLLLSVAMILANRMGLEEIPGRLRELRDEGTRRKGRRERQRENERDGDRDEAQAIDLELEKKIREAEDLTRLWIALLNADALYVLLLFLIPRIRCH
ncbi:hypothetical protein K435DRAFT_404952 [Dendrothele bispora CBS 962.96]|uniref:Uncharacterized protein n=1 Tax=Dendrothele bispora (strain CBS 962.96) TaxID=1314807 RepID=A0A4S8L898_DENBC|nr:hypothetical protein K435DRAFT_404952 [Dendrothele bispora CBS 962.96]